METIGGLTQYYDIVSFNGQLGHGEEVLEGITVNDARHGRINNGTLWNIRVYAIPSALLLLHRGKSVIPQLLATGFGNVILLML